MEGVLAIQADLERFALDGPDLDLSPQAALSLSLLLHELDTNAVKYGALSTDTGRVSLTWRTDPGPVPTLAMTWVESGGPSVAPPSKRRGFGSTLIRLGLMGTGTSELCYSPEGLRAEFRAPLPEIQSTDAP